MAQADGTIIIDTELDVDGAKKGSKELESQIRNLAGTVDGVGSKAKAALNKQVDAFSKLNNEYAAQTKKVDELKQKIEDFSKKKITATEEYKQLSKELFNANTKLEKLEASQKRFLATGGRTYSNTYRKYQYDIDATKKSIEELRTAEKDMIKNHTASMPVTDMKEYADMQNQLSAAEAKRVDMQNRLGTSMNYIIEQVDEYNQEASKMAIVAEKVKSAFAKLGNAIKRVAKLTGSGVIGGLKKLSAGILGIHKSANKSTYSMGMMIKNALVMGALYKGISGASSAIKSGFENLAQYSGSTNNSISMLWSSLERLKNSLATAFAPILNIVAPILTKFINMISTAVSYVGAFFSALTGKSTYTKAVGVQKNYAASLKDTASGAKDAAKETEKAADAANDYLSPLDDINRFSEDNKSSSSPSGSTGGGVGGIDPSSMFTEAPIESNIKGLAQKIKDLIKNEDFEGLGAFLAEQLNAGMAKVKDAISWEKVGPQITYFVNAFTTTFNSLVDNLDWDLLGRTIGTGVNTIVNALDLLITGIDWKNLGAKFAEGINGLVDEVDFYHLGELIGHKIMIWPSIVLGFVTNLNWVSVGNQLGKGLNGVVNSISLSDIGAALGRAITGIFRTAINFAATFDWLALGRNVANGVNSAFSNTDWATVGQGISNFVRGCLSSLITAIENIDWAQILDAAETLIASIDWLGIATDLVHLFMNALGIAFGLVGKLIYDIGLNIIEGVKNGALAGITNIPAWIKAHIFQPFIDGFKNAFGIHSPSTVMRTMGQYIIQGLLNGITDLVAYFREKFNELKTIAINKLIETKDGAVRKGSEMRESLSQIVESIRGKFSNGFKNIASTVGSKVQEAKNAAVQKAQDMLSSLSNIIGNIQDRFHNGFQNLVSIVRNPINRVLSMINALLRAAQTMQNNFANALNSMNIQLPGWLQKLTGWSSVGFNVGYWSAPQVPYLAQGAVIPPNKEFMAVLGDQRNGNNIEAPENLIRQIVREEAGGLGGGTYNFTANINRRTLFKEVIDEAKMQRISTGKNPFELA